MSLLTSGSITDVQLLETWRRGRDPQAFDRLVRNHIGYVFAAARRQVRDRHLAEDVTQAVFMLLVRKLPRLRDDAALVVWLHRTTRYACANARRMEARRIRRETHAVQMLPPDVIATNSTESSELLPLLDDAIAQLPPRDRDGVLLCYFARQTFRQIGTAMGTSEEAARKRVTRAVDRLREYFAARGVTTTAVAIAACLASESTFAAPAALAASTVNVAALSIPTGPSGLIMKGVVQTMLLAKVKLAAAACVVLTMSVVMTATAIHQSRAEKPAVVASESSNVVTLDSGTQIEFIGVARFPDANGGWVGLDGKPIENPGERVHIRAFNSDEPRPTHQALVRLWGPDNAGWRTEVPESSVCLGFDQDGQGADNELYVLVTFTPKAGSSSTDLQVQLADGGWQTVLQAQQQPGRALAQQDTPLGGIAITHLVEGHGGSVVYVAHEIKDRDWTLVAQDARGDVHRPMTVNGGAIGKFSAWVVVFGMAPDEIDGVALQTRPFDTRVTFKNLTLDASKPSVGSAEVKPIEQEK